MLENVPLNFSLNSSKEPVALIATYKRVVIDNNIIYIKYISMWTIHSNFEMTTKIYCTVSVNSTSAGNIEFLN